MALNLQSIDRVLTTIFQKELSKDGGKEFVLKCCFRYGSNHSWCFFSLFNDLLDGIHHNLFSFIIKFNMFFFIIVFLFLIIIFFLFIHIVKERFILEQAQLTSVFLQYTTALAGACFIFVFGSFEIFLKIMAVWELKYFATHFSASNLLIGKM